MPYAKEAPALLATTLATLIATIPAQAWAQDAQAQQMQRVEITGSSIKRIDAETALPVQVITREQIQRSGATNVEQLLQTISSVSSSGGLTAASASGATTGGISAVSLHGLTSIRTLVLLNGRRIAPYGIGFTGDSVSVDVNSIPLAAIERVEVLKDGASAVYGSDAIAGVINFILRQEFKGLELTAEYGDTTQGGANFKRATGTFGFGNLATDRFNVLAVASYQKEGALFGRDRMDFAGKAYNVEQHQRHHLRQHLPGQHRSGRRIGRNDQPFRTGLPGTVLLQRPAVPARPLPLRPVAVGDADSGLRARQRLRLGPVCDHSRHPGLRRGLVQQEQDPHRHPAGAALGPVQHSAAERALQPGAVQQHRRQRLRLDLPAPGDQPLLPDRLRHGPIRRRRPTCSCATARR